MSALRQVVLLALLTAGCGSTGCAPFQRAEDASCASAEEHLPEMTPGTVKNATIVYVNACRGLDAAEHDGVAPCTTTSTPPSASPASR